MKFVISSSALLSVLQTTGRVVSTRNTLPILNYFLLDLKDGVLKVTASDLETTQVATVAVESVEKEGTIAAPVKLMLDLLKEFSEQPLTIEVNESTWEIKVQWRSGSLSIPGTSGQSYPELPELGADSKTIEFDVDALLNGVNKTVFAAADDELRPVLNGIFITLDSKLVTFVATDAHKLVKYTLESSYEDVQASFILPKKPVNLLKALLIREDGAIKVEFDTKNVIFHLKSNKLVCRQVEGNFPNYNAVIPPANPNIVVADRVELQNAIKRVAVCSNQATNLIKFEIDSNQIMLTAQDIDFSVSAKESLACDYQGEKITIGFKSTFLVEILANLDTETIKIELADSTRAGVFKPIYEEKSTESDTLMLLMPIMINL